MASRYAYAFLCAFFVTTLPHFQQTAFAQIQGTDATACPGTPLTVLGSVTDVSKAAIPFAVIEAACGKHTERTSSDQEGNYRLRLAPGSWTLHVEASGFTGAAFPLNVAPETRHIPDITLSVSGGATAVTVMAQTGLIATTAESTSKIDTPILEQPFSIQTITGTQLQQQNVQSLNQALKYTAGATPEVYGPDPRGDWFSIRGNAADVYLDGLRLPQVVNTPSSGAALQIDPNDIQRFEILEGPSSTLYGQSNIGGIVDAISKQATVFPRRAIQLQGGNFDRIQGGAEASGPLNRSATLLYQINGIARSSHTYVYGAKDDRYTLNPVLTWRPTTNSSLSLFGKFLHNDMGTAAVFLPRAGTLYRASYGYLPTSFNTGDPATDRYRKRQYIGGLTYDYRASTWNIHESARFVHANITYTGLYSAGNLPNNDAVIARVNFRWLPSLDGFQTDFHAQKRFRTGKLLHTVIGGLDYQWQSYRNRQGGVNGATLNLVKPVYGVISTPPPFSTRADQTQFQGGAYGQEQAQIAGWTFVAGGRYDQTTQETNNLITGVKTPQSPHAFTGHVGASYRTRGLAPYISYSTSFLPTIGTDYYGKAFQPTKGGSYEGGLKYQLPNHAAMMTFTGFSMTQNNRTTTDMEHIQYQIQIGQVRTIGYELQGNGTILKSLDLSLGYTHLRPVVTRSNSNDYHKLLQPIAKDTVSLWTHYTVRRTFFTGIGLGGGARYIGPKWGDGANTFQTPGYTIFDGALDYTLEKWRFSLNSTNLLDKRYVSACSTTSNCYYGATRAAIGTISYTF